MHQSGILKAQLDQLIVENSERAQKHNVEITFEFFGHKYTVRPVQPYYPPITEFKS